MNSRHKNKKVYKAEDIIKALSQKASKAKAKVLSGFFKTGKGQYGEGDIFIGVNIPTQRLIAQPYASLFFDGCFSFAEIQKLLKSKIHEHRMTALFILVYISKDKRMTSEMFKKLFDFYLANIKYVNNWDLVDCSARDIVGKYLYEHGRSHPLTSIAPKDSVGPLPDLLKDFAKSSDLWKRRVAIVATHYHIMKSSFAETIIVAEMLMADRHDLIHKAVGWMLREMGKKDVSILRTFLDKWASNMPRTALRYSLERLSMAEKKYYMKAKISTS